MKKRRFFSHKVNLAIAGMLLFAVLVSSTSDERNFNISKSLSIYATLFRELSLFYVDDIEPQELVEKSIKSLLKELDPYTVYYSESDNGKLKILTKGEYGGVGCVVSKRGEKIIITQIYKNTPSDRSDLKAGDELVAIDEVIIEGKSITDVSKLLRGKPGDQVKLSVRRFGEKELIVRNISRANIQLPNIPYYGLIKDNIGYISLDRFTESASRDMRKALINLKTDGAERIIVDLRYNPGGLLDEAAVIANFFISKGETIVSTKGRIESMNRDVKSVNNPILPDIPVVFLIGRNSASASEILAGVMQDLDRAVVMGQRSFGKGLVQTTRDLVYNAKLKLTTAKYYIPSGRCVQALDYSHRNEDGSVGTIPDSLISEFSTRNGRKVYDGGGITPDVKINRTEYAEVTKQLVIKNAIFNFVTEYMASNEVIQEPGVFTVGDSIYSNFKSYLNRISFKYDTDSEIILKELERVAKEEKYYNLASEEFKSMKKKLSHSLDKDLDLFRKEIEKFIAIELIQRQYYTEGVKKYIINNDVEIDSAINMLGDSVRYNKILGIK